MNQASNHPAAEPPTTPAAPAPPPQARPEAAPRPRPSPPEPRSLPPYKVLLHNDPVNEMLYVERTIRELVGLTQPHARLVMLTAHTRGVALVTVTHKERAELFVEQFRSKNLTASIEPA